MLVSNRKNEAFIGVLNARTVPYPLVEFDIVAEVSEYGPLVSQLYGGKTGNFVAAVRKAELRLCLYGNVAERALEKA